MAALSKRLLSFCYPPSVISLANTTLSAPLQVLQVLCAPRVRESRENGNGCISWGKNSGASNAKALRRLPPNCARGKTRKQICSSPEVLLGHDEGHHRGSSSFGLAFSRSPSEV